MALELLCPQALIFVLFSMTHIVMDTLKQKYNSAFVKIWVSLIYTLVINLLCQRGLGTIAWFLILIPFVLMTTIVALILLAFGIDEGSDELKIFDKENQLTVIELPFLKNGSSAVKNINVDSALKMQLENEKIKAEQSANIPAAADGSSLGQTTKNQVSSYEESKNNHHHSHEDEMQQETDRNTPSGKSRALSDIQDETNEVRLKVLEKSRKLNELDNKYVEKKQKITQCTIDEGTEKGAQESKEKVDKLNNEFAEIKKEIKNLAEELNNLANMWVSNSVKYVDLAERDGDHQDKRLASAQRAEANEYASNAHHAKTNKYNDNIICNYVLPASKASQESFKIIEKSTKKSKEKSKEEPKAQGTKNLVENNNEIFTSNFSQIGVSNLLAPESYYMELPNFRKGLMSN